MHTLRHRLTSTLRRSVVYPLVVASSLIIGSIALANSSSTQDVAPRIPAPPTRSLSLGEALTEQSRIQTSADAQRHQPEGFPCAGFYPEHAAYRITLAQDQNLQIGADAHNSTDMTMAIHLENGSWLCNDDADENTRNPEVFQTLPSGTHTLYFGAYHRFQPLDYTPYIRNAEKPQWARCIDVDVINDPDERTTFLTGEISPDVYKCNWMLGAAHCDWFLPSKADACVDLSAPTDLVVRTQNATFDTTLVIQRVIDTADGPIADHFVLRNDDISPNNRHSEIQSELEPGRYLIFVGSYRRQKEGSFELQIGPIPLETP